MATTITFKRGRIAELRRGLGHSQLEFARLLSVSKQVVSQWEAGRQKPTVESLARIAAVTGAPIESFFEVRVKL